ncbi:hypothetical protein [Paraburkholderia fungorum]|uniref:hypothetical protein n=1 Tax=Paraburkholderia fungorum TaxID=134537 RepID=UPI0020927961|nr:hypothetical protein [Paraburkholderia fungorum]USU18909.1 hypothetical protein NFE55_32700 [Paraburkholderia fungorum]USU29095.1 hypothetical protein NFS19_28870 [Paraburkholderia fungorum]
MSTPVPDDFPRDLAPAALSGAQPKLAVRMIDGKFVAGLTAEERAERWAVCEDLAHQLVPKAVKDAARNPDHSHDETLRRIRRAIEGKGWLSVVETGWLMERLRDLLGW